MRRTQDLAKLRDILNRHNPAELYPLPIDEYDSEAEEILSSVKILRKNGAIDPTELALEITRIWKWFFDEPCRCDLMALSQDIIFALTG